MNKENYTSSIVSMITDYIEQNINKHISLDDIASFSKLSKHHLHRIFKALTDKKLMNYVKSRKLTNSINDLLNSDLRIIDIAIEYGFEYEQSYIRAFKREFGLSPDEFRKKRCSLKITDKVTQERFEPVGDKGLFFKPVIMIKPGFYIVGIKHPCSLRMNRENNLSTRMGNDFFYNYRHLIKNPVSPNVYMGIVDHTIGEPDNISYTAAIQVTDINEIPPEMVGRMIPTHKYAVFKYIGLHHPRNTTVSNVLDAYRFIYDWLDASNYCVADSFHFERIDEDIAKEDYCELELYIPIIDIQQAGSQFVKYRELYKSFFDIDEIMKII